MKEKSVKIFFIALSALLMPSFLFAATSAQVKIDNPLSGIGTIQDLVVKILEFFVKIGTIIAVLAIIWAGFLYIKAQGNSSKLAEAHQALLWAVIGGVIVIGAQVLSGVICNTVKELGANAVCQ